mgnify:CR=1 FL=1
MKRRGRFAAPAFSLWKNGQTFYTSNWGLAGARNQIAALVRRKYRLCYDADKEILVTVGGSEAIDNTIRAIVNVGDEVLIPEPSFVCYKPLTQMAGGVPVPLPTRAEDQFKLTADSLRAAITPRTKLLILPYPNNPTGAIMTRDELQAIATVIKDTNIIVLSDEIYNSLTYGPDRHVCFAELDGMKERTIVVDGFLQVLCDDRLASRLGNGSEGADAPHLQDSSVWYYVRADDRAVRGH